MGRHIPPTCCLPACYTVLALTQNIGGTHQRLVQLSKQGGEDQVIQSEISVHILFRAELQKKTHQNMLVTTYHSLFP